MLTNPGVTVADQPQAWLYDSGGWFVLVLVVELSLALDSLALSPTNVARDVWQLPRQ